MKHTKQDCPCGRPLPFQECCHRFIVGIEFPKTAEDLMRSRYSAYATGAIPYIHQTTHPRDRDKVSLADISQWIDAVNSWDKLVVLNTHKGQATDTQGTVEFVAHFHQKHHPQMLHEISHFTKWDARWMVLI